MDEDVGDDWLVTRDVRRDGDGFAEFGPLLGGGVVSGGIVNGWDMWAFRTSGVMSNVVKTRLFMVV